MDRQTVIEDISKVSTLGADEELETGGVIPSGVGLSKREAQLVLVEEMNKLIQTSNRRRLNRFQAEEKHWHMFGGTPPFPAIIAPGFSGRRHISQAVFMARQRGGYKELLSNAGFKS